MSQNPLVLLASIFNIGILYIALCNPVLKAKLSISNLILDWYLCVCADMYILIHITIHMNKQAIVDMVHEMIGGTKVQAESVVEGIISAITSTLKKGEEVSIAGLGIFSVKARAARMARNPKTGEQVSVPATTVPKFRASKALKDAVK